MAYKNVVGIFENEYDVLKEYRKMNVVVLKDGNKRTVRITDIKSGIALTATYEEEGKLNDNQN